MHPLNMSVKTRTKQAVIYPSAFLMMLGVGIVMIGIVFFLRDIYNAAPMFIGWFTAASSLFYLIGCLSFKPLHERLLPWKSMVISSSFLGILILSINFTHIIPVSFVLYSLFGLSLSLFWPQAMGWISHGYEGETLNKKLSLYNLSWSGGLIASSPIGGYLSQVNPGLPLITAAVLFFFTAGYIVFHVLNNSEYNSGYSSEYGMRPHSLSDSRYTGLSSETVTDSTASLDRETSLRYPAWVGLFTTYIVIGIIFNIYPIFATEVLGITKTGVGVLLLTRAAATTAVFILLGRTEFWHFNRGFLLANQILLAVSVIMLSLLIQFWTLEIIMILLGLFFAVNYNESIFHGVSGSTHRASRMATHEAILTAGMVGGSVAGGIIYQIFSMHTLIMLCVGLITFGVFIQVFLIKRLHL
ncbi:MAG: MFS transporter [Spirochaetales bacterium]|nr:MFS transporter [Spirochaetales bacterium]